MNPTSSFVFSPGNGLGAFHNQNNVQLPSNNEIRSFIAQQQQLRLAYPGRAFEEQLRHAIQYMNIHQNEDGWPPKFSALFTQKGEGRKDKPASPSGAAAITSEWVGKYPDLFPEKNVTTSTGSQTGNGTVPVVSTTLPATVPVKASFMGLDNHWMIAAGVILLGGMAISLMMSMKN